jgi:D-alanyl-D-alanine dipeptidase
MRVEILKKYFTFLLMTGALFMTLGNTPTTTPSIISKKIMVTPIIESHEPMVDLTQQSEIMYGPSPEIPNNTNYTKIRKTVYEKLQKAQSLLPEGLRFCIYEGYRSLSLQKMLFDLRFEKIRALHPDWTHEQLFTETIRMVSPVVTLDGSKNIPPHSTGAAIDIYLVNERGEAVNMGIHPKDWMNDTDGSISLTASTKISEEAQKYRKIMSNVLEEVGFINYTAEYWHWSYGDRYWAVTSGQSYAIYDTVDSHNN